MSLTLVSIYMFPTTDMIEVRILPVVAAENWAVQGIGVVLAVVYKETLVL